MKLAALALLAGSAAAFAPAQTSKASTALSADFSSEIGAQPPLGCFDPLGMLTYADQERFDRLRYVEIKHGRIAQLAFLGQITTRAGVHLPGNLDLSGHKFSDYPNGLKAFFGPDAIPAIGFLQIFLFIGYLELFVMKDSANGAAPGEFVGDFRNNALDFGWDSFSDAQKTSKRAVELNNGRAAMMGILGLMVHEQLGSNMPIIGQL